MESEYARRYRELYEATRTNGIHLVLGTYSMAVNGQSPPEVVGFYHMSHPGAGWQIKANQAHSEIVRQLVAEHPDIGLADTGPVLDGRWEYFTDLAHFTPEGDARMAEIFYAAIKEILAKDLVRTGPGAANAK